MTAIDGFRYTQRGYTVLHDSAKEIVNFEKDDDVLQGNVFFPFFCLRHAGEQFEHMIQNLGRQQIQVEIRCDVLFLTSYCILYVSLFYGTPIHRTYMRGTVRLLDMNRHAVDDFP